MGRRPSKLVSDSPWQGLAFGSRKRLLMALDEREKQAITRLRADGLGYKAIASTLNVSRDQVRAFTTRHGIAAGPRPEDGARWCRWCGSRLPERSDGKKPRFCCTEHRRLFWRSHPEAGVRKAFYQFTCVNCGTQFEAYGNATRKYCSHACYIRHRFNTRGGK